MAKYMSQVPPEPKPKPRKIKPSPAKGPRKPRGKMPEREMPKRISDPKDLMPKIPKIPKPSAAPLGRKVPAKRSSMEARDPRRALPAKDAAKGIMGSTESQAQARQKKALDDMRKRMMLRPKRELKSK